MSSYTLPNGVTISTPEPENPSLPIGTPPLPTLLDGQFNLNVADIITKSPEIDIRSKGAKGDNITDNSDNLQSVIGLLPSYNKIKIPVGKFIITKPLYIPVGVSIEGCGGGSMIVADYSRWQGTDYRAIIVGTREGGQILPYQVFKDFSVVGINNDLILSTGIEINCSTPNIPLVWSVNYSLIDSIMDNIGITQFDTGLKIVQAWNTGFRRISTARCRVGISIVGKSVNLTFSDLTLFGDDVNLRNYTSSSEDSIGLYVASGFHYQGGVEGRPEGITVNNSLIYGFDNNCNISSILFMRISNSILDGGGKACVTYSTPSQFTVDNCYIATVGDYGVLGTNIGSTNDSSIRITNNDIHSLGGDAIAGISFGSANACRQYVTVQGNKIDGWSTGIDLTNCPNKSFIINNNLSSILNGIYVQNGGDNTIIDGNMEDGSCYILVCHPLVASPQLKIGRNYSPQSTTYYTGKVTLGVGETAIPLPNNFYSKPNVGINAYVRLLEPMELSSLGNITYNKNTNWSAGDLIVQNAPVGTAKVITYEVTAMPGTF